MPQNKYEVVPQKIENAKPDSVNAEKTPPKTEQPAEVLSQKTEQEVPTPKEHVKEGGAQKNKDKEKENNKAQVAEGSEDQSKKEAKAENGEKSPEKAILGEITKEATEIAQAIDKNPEVKKRAWLKKIALAYLIFTGGNTLTTAMDGYLAKAQEGSPTDEKQTVQKATQNYAEEAFSAIKGVFKVNEAQAGGSSPYDKALSNAFGTILKGPARGASKALEVQAERALNGGVTVKEQDRANREAERIRREEIRRAQKMQDNQIRNGQRMNQDYQRQGQDMTESVWQQRESALKAYQQELRKAKTPQEIEVAKMKYQEMLKAINEMEQMKGNN